MDIDETIEVLGRKRSTLRDEGIEAVREARDIYHDLQRYIDRYREPATGHGDFESYIEFQSVLAEIEEQLDDDVYGERWFRKAIQRFESRTLREKHFRRAEKDLQEIRELVEAFERAMELEDELRSERGRLRKRRRELQNEIKRLESRIRDAREAPDADASRLESLLDKYNKSVEREYGSWLSSAPAIEVVRHAYRASRMPLVEADGVDGRSVEALQESGVGDESVERLLEFAGYSDSKLQHYVDDPRTFRDKLPTAWFRVADAEPYKLSLDMEEGVVERLVPELVSVVSEFASERTIEVLRQIGDLARNGRYSEMRQALEARQRTGGEDVESLLEEKQSLEREVEDVEEDTQRIEDALDDRLRTQ